MTRIRFVCLTVLATVLFVAGGAHLSTPLAEERNDAPDARSDAVKAAKAEAPAIAAEKDRDEAERQRAIAQAERAAAQQHLVTSHFLRARIAHSEGDTAGALTWYHQAYRDAAPDDPRRTSARNLIGAWGGSLKQTLVNEQGVHTVAISPDGRKLLAGRYGSRAQIWDLATGMPQGEPLPCGGDIVSAQFSPDGDFALIGDWGGAKVWDVATGQLRYPTLEHEVREDTVLGPVLSPDGRSIVTRSPFTGIRIWDAETGKPRSESLSLGEFVGRMVFAPDSKRVAAQGGGVVQVCDVETAKQVGEAFTDAIGLAFHPAGRVVAVSHRDGKIVLRDLDSGKQIAELDHGKPLRSLEFDAKGKNLLCRDDENAYLWLDVLRDDRTRRVLHHGRGLFTAAFSPTTDYLLTASSLKLRVWPVDHAVSGWERSELPNVSQSRNQTKSVVFSPDGKSLLTLKENDTAEVVSIATGQMLVRELNVLPRAATFSADGSSVIFGSSDGWVRIRSVSASDERRLPQALPGSICSGSVIALSPDGKLIFVVGPTAKSHIYRTDTWELVGKPLEGLYSDFKDGVGGAAFSPDSRLLVASMSIRNPKQIFRSNAHVEFWDVATTSRVGEPISLPDFASVVTFDPTGKYVRVGNSVYDVEKRSILTFAPDRIPEGHQPVIQLLHHSATSIPPLCDDKDGPTTVHVPGEDVKQALLSPDGRRLLIVRNDGRAKWGSARLHDAATGTPLGPAFQADGFPFGQTDDGRYTLFSTQRTVRLWDTQLGRPCGDPLLNEQSNVRPSFSPDGTVVVTNWWVSAQLWDCATGLELGPPMRMPSTGGARPVFSTDGSRLYIPSSGLEVWRVLPPAADEPERLRLSIEVRTGLEVDENATIQRLSQADWLERKRRLKQLGGPCDVAE